MDNMEAFVRDQFKYSHYATLTKSEFDLLIKQAKEEAVAEYKQKNEPEWHLVKDGLPDKGRLVWFYPPLIAHRTGRWNPASSRSNEDKDHWSPDYGADNLGAKDDLIAWAYAKESQLPKPGIEFELQGDRDDG